MSLMCSASASMTFLLAFTIKKLVESKMNTRESTVGGQAVAAEESWCRQYERGRDETHRGILVVAKTLRCSVILMSRIR